jgi:uridine kinase
VRADLIRELAGEIERSGRLIGVDGVDGAGKTVLADELAAELRRRDLTVVRVSVDDFHNPTELRYRRGRGDPEGFFRDSYDYESFVSLVLEPFARGSGTYVPGIHDVDTEQEVRARPAPVLAAALLVVDGIFLHRDELAGWWDYSIWLEVPFEVSIPRGAARGYGHPDPADPSNRRYLEGQRIYLRECEPASRATVVIDNTDLAAPLVVRRT